MSAFSRQIWVLLLVTVAVVLLTAIAVELGNGTGARTAQKSNSTENNGRNTTKSEAQPQSSKSGSFTDKRDGKKYRTVKIGNQTWMAENLNYKYTGYDSYEYSVCYDGDTSNCNKYGKLYNWYEAMKACPVGWHIPTSQEWDNLIISVGGKKMTDKAAWSEAGKILKSKNGWKRFDGRGDGNGTDDYGFSALPGGMYTCCVIPNIYYNLNGNSGFWWTATVKDSDDEAITKLMMAEEDEVYDVLQDRGYSMSVRCLHD